MLKEERKFQISLFELDDSENNINNKYSLGQPDRSFMPRYENVAF